MAKKLLSMIVVSFALFTFSQMQMAQAQSLITMQRIGLAPLAESKGELRLEHMDKGISSISLSKRSITIEVGQFYFMQMTLRGTGTKPDYSAMKFDESDPLIVDVYMYEEANATYNPFYILGVQPGTTKLTISLGGKSASMSIRVVKPPEKRVLLSSGRLGMVLGESAQLDATVLPTSENQAVVWKSSNKKIASVDASGLVFAKKKGKAIITCTSSSGQKATCEVEVVSKAAPAKDFTFSVSNGKALITKYKGKAKNLVIPDALNGYPVDSIGASAFSGNKTLYSVAIPQDLTYIGANAFLHCEKLVSVQLPTRLKSLEDGTFAYCMKLKVVTLPNGLERIGNEAFSNCYNLSKVEIPSTVKSIGANAFDYCTRLAEINLPDSLETLGEYALAHCASFTSITFPTSLKVIPQGLLRKATSLRSIVIPDQVTKIEAEAFYGNYALRTAIIGRSVRSIGREAFAYCYNLKEITIPPSVTSMNLSLLGVYGATIYGQPGSYAQFYALLSGYPFVSW